MNRKKLNKLYLIVFCLILIVITIPKPLTERLQGRVVALWAPIWNVLHTKKDITSPSTKNSNTSLEIESESFQRLNLQNKLLHEEILYLKNVMQNELDLLEEMKKLSNEENRFLTKKIRKRHRQELQKLLTIELNAIPAQVIFRPQSTWNSFLWINIGKETPEIQGTDTLVKNSPVLLGTSVIGIIDYVGRYQSKVRLITDPLLTASVRVARKNNEENTDFLYLAKGEIHGAKKTQWRKPIMKLEGKGFNYDFPDEEGEARDLRTGKLMNEALDKPSISLVEEGDLLVTTGLDGVFPKNLSYGKVLKVYPLK